MYYMNYEVKDIIQQTVAVYDCMASVSVRMRGHGLRPRLNAGPCVAQNRRSCRYMAYGLYLYLFTFTEYSRQRNISNS